MARAPPLSTQLKNTKLVSSPISQELARWSQAFGIRSHLDDDKGGEDVTLKAGEVGLDQVSEVIQLIQLQLIPAGSATRSPALNYAGSISS